VDLRTRGVWNRQLFGVCAYSCHEVNQIHITRAGGFVIKGTPRALTVTCEYNPANTTIRHPTAPNPGASTNYTNFTVPVAPNKERLRSLPLLLRAPPMTTNIFQPPIATIVICHPSSIIVFLPTGINNTHTRRNGKVWRTYYTFAD